MCLIFADAESRCSVDELDYSYCHIDEYVDDDFSCLDYMECEECPYYYEDEE
jgi:hypothetical protein